jgi:plastocyanin
VQPANRKTALMAALLLAACSLHAHTVTESAEIAAAASQSHTVVIKSFKYEPGVLTIKRGDRVEWKNEDIVPHTVTAQDKSFDSGDIPPGRSWRLTANKAGIFEYGCVPHPNMEAKLVVR